MNGVLEDEFALEEGPFSTGTSEYTIRGAANGEGSVDYFLPCEIDEFRMWYIVLTGEEIRADMNRPVVGTVNGLVARYGFDERSGQSVFDSTCNGYGGTRGSTDSPGNDDPDWVCSGAPLSGCKADFNDDGVVNTLDVLAFLNAWSVGCP